MHGTKHKHSTQVKYAQRQNSHLASNTQLDITMQRSRQEEKVAYRLVLGIDTKVKKQVASNSVLGHKDDPCSYQILVTTGNTAIDISIFGKGKLYNNWV